MEKLTQKEHDFSAKLRQKSVIDNLRRYITWQREVRASSPSPLPEKGPVSINLDLTTACNFRCPHCVDSGIINTGESIDLDVIRESIDTLHAQGLLSVILIGGGEPTVHRDFEEIVRIVKDKGLQVGIATNGSRLERVARVAGLLTDGDWVRLSLDAAREDTFVKSHRPPAKVTLKKILEDARALKAMNPKISLGYSFVIVWDGITYGGAELAPNMDEVPEAVAKAVEYGFDYVSFKPCLLRLEGSGKESLFDPPDPEREERVIREMEARLAEAERICRPPVKVLKSVNLQAMLEGKLHELKNQPVVCHSQFFRTVLAPAGIFHCPALRGVSTGIIGDREGYRGIENFRKTQETLERSIKGFDAHAECSVVVCFYHHVNWWIEKFIQSDTPVSEIREVEDNNFFL
ncbi:MAG TPA: radical SAM protein [Deltaproteobacteria bacterium]|jgi:MoaA/NifB/PqqE/SkfB family radical SAM enzyme|nr:radical SAM protein [Deltaproteobacteria bacterium]HOI07728.1 radical SAM protein [Deltaproteobacteria bacterium]